MPRPALPLRAVTALFLERQHLARPHAAALTARRLGRFVEDVGGLQMDSINVLERAHYLTVWSRFGPYDRARLDRLVYRRRLLFEYYDRRSSSRTPRPALNASRASATFRRKVGWCSTPAGFPCRVMTISSDSAKRRNRDRSSLTSASATWRIGRPVLGEPTRRFGFRDDREDFDGFGCDVIKNSYLPNPEAILRRLRGQDDLIPRITGSVKLRALGRDRSRAARVPDSRFRSSGGSAPSRDAARPGGRRRARWGCAPPSRWR